MSDVLVEDMKESIRTIPDFPKKGVLFRDITPLLFDREKFKKAFEATPDFLPSFIRFGLFNPLFTPWWFYCFGYFNNPERTKFHRFIKNAIFLFWFIVLIASVMMSPVYQKQLQQIKETQLSGQEIEEGKLVVETFTQAISNVAQGFTNIPNESNIPEAYSFQFFLESMTSSPR